jgi:hypothetical protein
MGQPGYQAWKGQCLVLLVHHGQADAAQRGLVQQFPVLLPTVQGRQRVELALDGPIGADHGVGATHQPDAHDALQRFCPIQAVRQVQALLDQGLAKGLLGVGLVHNLHMLFSMILTPKPNSALKTLLCGALALFFAMPAPAQSKSDDVLLEMQQAFKQGRQKAPRCPAAAGPWPRAGALGGLLGTEVPAWAKPAAQEVQDFHDALRRHLPGRPACATTGCSCSGSGETGPTLPPNTRTTA